MRRARIKAITSLPPRRNNADAANNKNTSKERENANKCSNSPRSPSITNNESNNSPPTINKSETPKSVTPNNQSVNDKTCMEAPKTPNPSKTPKHLIEVPYTLTTYTTDGQNKKSPVKRFASSPLSKTQCNSKKRFETQDRCDQSREIVNIAEIVEKNDVTSINRHTYTDNESQDCNEYNPPSLSDSITDETVMDGIVPLQTIQSIPKPINLLKNEIISENAEVLFDPIVPLPSPSKVRPKLRPAPRLAPLRRNSIQGSASESEDETRRQLFTSSTMTPALYAPLPPVTNREVNRVRNDSVCSGISQITVPPPLPSSPLKEKHISKSRRQEMSKRMLSMRRRRATVKRDELTMYDLIFYNPTTNPIVPDQEEVQAKQEMLKVEVSRKTEPEDEEDGDDPIADEAEPVPQIKLGPNGEIILDEKSLVIKQTQGNRKVLDTVREGPWMSSGGKYTRTARTAEWSEAETVRFYRALAALGTDFTLMAPLFPTRTRRDLKIKFKKEEKLNGSQVDKALRSATAWDATTLEKEFTAERYEAERSQKERNDKLEADKLEARQRAKAARQRRVRQSRATQAIESTMLPGLTQEITTADEFIERKREAKMNKRKLPRSTQMTSTSQSRYATLTLLNQEETVQTNRKTNSEIMATISKLGPKPIPSLNPISAVPTNIETGSLVVLTVNDPNSPSKKMLQTYISHGAGNLTPVALPATLLNSVVDYMKKGASRSNASTGSSPLLSPESVTSHTSAGNIVQIPPNMLTPQRNSTLNLTQL